MKSPLVAFLFFFTALFALGQTASTPAVSGITPTNAPPGAQVTISGSNLAGVSAVTFGGVRSSSFLYDSSTGTISAKVPLAARSGNVVVTTSAGASAGFNYLIPLTISALPFHGVVASGQSYVFRVTVGGGVVGATYSYAWTRQGSSPTSIGFNLPNLYIPSVSEENVGDYAVSVTDGTSTVTSGPIALRLARGDLWTWRNPVPTANDLWSVTYGGGKWLAVGSSGTFVGSTDNGGSWSLLGEEPVANFTRVLYAGGKFVAVGAFGNVMSSPDLTSGEYGNVGEPTSLYSLAERNGLWLAAGAFGLAYSSTDLVSWTRYTTGASDSIYALTATADGFLGLSVGGTVVRGVVGSGGAITWTASSSGVAVPSTGWAAFIDVKALSGGTYVASGSDGLYTSANGSTWTKVATMPTTDTSVDWQTIAVGPNGALVVVGNRFSNNTYGSYLAVSNDAGATWTPRTIPGGPVLIGAAYANNRYVAVGALGHIITSTDAVTWTKAVAGGPTFSTDFYAIASGAAGSVASGSVGTTYLSANHETSWSKVEVINSGETVAQFQHRILGATYAGGRYVLVGGNEDTTSPVAFVFTSTSGASGSWSKAEIPGLGALNAITSQTVNGTVRYIAAGLGTNIYYTSDPASTWTPVAKPDAISTTVLAAAADGSRIVLTGENGLILRSTDGGATWAKLTTPVPGVRLEAVATNGAGVWIAAGYDGRTVFIRSSDNGVTWSRVGTPYTGSIRALSFADGRFRSVGGVSTMLVSSDGGLTWSAESTNFPGQFRALVRTPKGYLAAGSFGAIASMAQPSVVPLVSERTLVAGASLAPFAPVSVTGAVPPYTYSVFPALPEGLQINAATGQISGTPTAASSTPLFVGSDAFSTDSVGSKWVGFYRTLGSVAANGQLAVGASSGRLDFSKGTGDGSYFLRWDGDPQVSGSSRTTASYATSWRADVTATNGATVAGSEYSSVGLQVVADSGWAAIMVTRSSAGVSVRGESSSILTSSSPSATVPSGAGVRLRLEWDAGARTLKGSYSTDGGATFTELLTLGSSTWVANATRGFFHEVFANSTVVGALSGGSNYLDDFSVVARSVASAVFTISITDDAGVVSNFPVTLRFLPSDRFVPTPVLWQQFVQTSTEQAPGRTIHATGGKVYVPWSVYDRNPDMVGGRLVGPLARLNESDGSLDTSFRIDRFVRAVNHVVPLSDGRLLAAVRVGDVDAVGRFLADGTLDESFSPAFFARGVRFITLQSDGKVLVTATDNLSVDAPAGALAKGVPVVLRLNADGTQDTSFSVTLNEGALLLAPPVVDSSGRVYLAGVLNSVNGTARVNVARVSSAGVLDAAFADPATVAGFGSVQARAFLIQLDGKVVVLGDFRSTARGTFSNPMMAIRFTSAGAYDETYARPLRSDLGITGLRLRHGVLLSDNKIVAVSDRLVRLNADGTRDTAFVSRAFGKEAFWVSRAADGRLFVADQISVAAADGSPLSLANNGIACFAADGTPDFSFQTGGWGRSAPAASGLPLSDGRVWVAGSFNRYGDSPVPGVAQFSSTGALASSQVVSSRLMSSAMVVPAGSDKAYLLAATAPNSFETFAVALQRIGADGAVDSSFSPALPAGYSLGSASIFESPGGKLLLFQGSVTAQAILNGETGDGLLRLNADGTRDTSFNSTLSSFASVERNASNAITMIRTGGFGVGDVLADGRMLAGSVGVDGAVKLFRLNADGAVDSTFSPASFGSVTPSSGYTSSIKDPVTNTTAQFPISSYDAGSLIAAARQGPDGKVYVGGRLALPGAPRGLVRLTATGSVDTTFTGTGIDLETDATSPAVSAMVFDDSGRLYVAGQFDTFNGNPVPGLFRLKADGSFDASWQPGIGIDLGAPRVTATLRVSGGKLYAFGTVFKAGDTALRSWAVADIGVAPVIAGISPASAAAGATVTISGSNLAGVTRVSFGGLGASFTYNSTAGTISATVPPGATSGTVEVTTAGGSSVGFAFTVPLVIAAQPASAVVRSGGGFFLQVRATGGTPPYAFQWRKGLEVLTGANSPGYSRSNVGSADTGAYNVVVTDAAGASVTSSTAVISLSADAGTFRSDAAFVRPEFKQDVYAGRVTVDAQGRIYATWTNGNYLSGAAGQLRGAVIRLKPDGTLDDSFNIGPALVEAWPVVPLPDGKVLVGGIASNESGETGYSLPRVFRFNADGSRDYAYNSPHFAALPRFMTLQPDGRLLVVASSSTTGNGGIPVMARLNPDGSPDGSFMQPVLSANGSIFCPPVVDAEGRIYVGGIFSTINGVARPAVARLNPDGSVDTTWTPAGFTVAGSAQVRGLALQTQGVNAGKLLVAGGPLFITGSSVNRPVIRLNPTGELDSTFTLVTQADAGMTALPRLLVSLPDDRFYVVGAAVTRFLATGGIDTSYTKPVFSTEFFWMDATADGRVIVSPEAGATVNGVQVPSLVRFTAGGAVDSTFAPAVFNREGYPGRFAVLDDGKLITWGSFDRVNGVALPGIARFNLNGTLDTAFNVSGLANLKYVAFAEVGSDGKILAGTRLASGSATLSSGISRLNADGTADGTFTLDSQLAGRTDGLEFRLLPDNKVAVWSVTAQGVVSKNNFLGRLIATGAMDGTFDAPDFGLFGAVYRANGDTGPITSITLGAARILAHDANGRLIGRATTGSYDANATSISHTLVRVNTDGSRDTTFSAPVVSWPTATSFPRVTDAQTNGGVAGQVRTTVIAGAPFAGVLPLADGKYLVFGGFQSLSSQTARGVARLSSNGALDTSFSVGIGAELRNQPGRLAQVQGVSVAADGKLWVTGAFDTFGGYAAPGIVRLNADGTVDTSFATDIVYQSYLGGGAQVGFAANGTVYVSGTYSRPGEKFPSAFQALVNAPAPSGPVFGDLGGNRRLIGEGQSLSLSPVVSGAASYQWKRNGRPISGANSATLSLSSVSAISDAGYYELVAFSGAGQTGASVVSPPIFVVVAFPSAIGAWGGWYAQEVGASAVPAGLSDVVAIAAGSDHTLALRAGGSVVAWGRVVDGALAVPLGLNDAVAVSAGSQLSAALRANGSVVTWGFNTNPGQMAAVPPDLGPVVAISVGSGHVLALKADGTVVAWGNNNHGQVGVPAGLSGVVAVSAGGLHCLALKSDGTVVAWGGSTTGSGINVVPGNLSGVRAIWAGNDENVAVREDGSTVTWGQSGSLGSGFSGVRSAAVFTGGLALKTDGSVARWGVSAVSWVSANPPFELTNVVGIGAGSDHAVVLRRVTSSSPQEVAVSTNYLGALPAGDMGAKAVASYRRVAVKFVPSAGVTFSSARLNLGASSAGSLGSVSAFVHADASGAPGQPLLTLSTLSVDERKDYTFTPASGALTLAQGVPYWLVLEPATPGSGSSVLWYAAGTDQLTPWGYGNFDGSAWGVWILPTLTNSEPAKALQVFGTLSSSSSGGGGSPAITSVNPDPIQPGAPLAIYGTNLPASGSVSVRIGNVDLTGAVTNAPPMGITANVPPSVPTGSQTLTVTLPGGVVLTRAVNVAGTGGSSTPMPLVTGIGPLTATAPADSRMALGVTTVAASAVTYAWTKDGGALTAATASSYAFNLVSGTAGAYGLAVSAGGSSVTQSMTLSVGGSGTQPTYITGLPRSVFAQSGRSVALGVSVYGGSGITFKWSRDGAPLDGQAGNVLDLGSVSSTQAGGYMLTTQLGSDVNTARSVSTRLVVGAGADAFIFGPWPTSIPSVGSTVTISGTAVPGDGATYVWERKPAGSSTFGVISTASGSVYSVAAVPGGTQLTISSLTTAMAGDEFRFVVARGGVSLTSEPYVISFGSGGGSTPTLSVEGVVRAWETDTTRVGAIVNGQVFNVWTKVTAGLGTNTNLNPPPAAPSSWGRLLSSTGFSSIAGESGITFKFGDLFFNPATFVSGANGNNGGITVQEYVPSLTARTPVEFYDSTGAILAKGFMEKVVNRVVYSTGAATGEASLVLNATGPAVKSAAFLQEVLQLTRGTGRLSVQISSYVATVLNNSYFDYLSTGSIVAAPVSEAARFIASASSMAKVPASGSQVTFRIPPGVNRKVLVRAVVSALPALGVTSGLLADPQLTLKDSGGTTLLSNDDWGSAANAASIETVSASVGAVVMVAGSKDAAILAELAPGTYTVEVKGAASGSGIVLVELHAPENLGVPAFTQVALQGPAGGADGSQILGFVLGGGAASDVLVRSVGPALGVGGLEDPRLNLTSGQSQQIATNDNWDGLAATTVAFTQAGASALTIGSKDSSVLLRLAPGAYVASSSAPTGAASGAVRTEVFLLPGGTVDALIHTADLDRDGRIALLELTRVIELYNTRNGTTRTGCYAVATTTTTEDGFVADAARVSSAVATLQRHHSADSNRDGKISLTELTRVIELYNYRSNTTRTGQYRSQAGTEDGFAPGP